MTDKKRALVAAQPGIWMADKLSTLPNSWSVAHYVELKGGIDSGLLSQAIIRAMGEADTLTMAFGEEAGVAWQQVQPDFHFSPPHILDLQSHPDPQAAARAVMEQDLAQDLRLSRGQPLYHHCLMHTGPRQWLWYQRYHHLVVDGYSFTAITRRTADIYSALCQQIDPPPSPFTPFGEVVDEYQHYQQSPACERDRHFWRETVSTLAAPLTLSAQPVNSAAPHRELIRQRLAFDGNHFRTLCAASPQCSAADIALALINLWLSRVSNRPQFSAGFIFMRRIGSSALTASGPVLNVLPYETRLQPGMTLAQLAGELAKGMKQLRRHQRYDAEQIQRDRGASAQGAPLYSTVVNLKMFDYRLDFNGVQGITHQLASGPVRDLEIALYLDEQGGAGLEILANADRYNLDELAAHLQRLPLILRQLAADPGADLTRINIVHPAEQALIDQANATGHPLPAATLSEHLSRQALDTPDAPALADQHHQLTYREMRLQVLALAQQLRNQGVQPGDVVAVALPRSVFLSLALQAIVEVGAAWLPLDTGYPDERLQMMLEDAAPRLLITQADQQSRFAGLPDLRCYLYSALLEEATSMAPLGASHPNHTAYVIYTSGSTGRPKGVMVGQQAIVNRLLWMQNHYPLHQDDVVLQKTPSSFDVSVWEFFWPLMMGARLVMAPPEAHRDPLVLRQLLVQWQVTTMHFVPSMLAAFVAAMDTADAARHCASLRRVFCSGEALPTDLCREWERLTAAPLHNLYGPTEAAVDVSWYPAYGEALAAVTGPSVPIGWPVWNTGLRILDGAMQPLPPGVAGDLYLTGVQLAQGYLARPDLTASRFIADPFDAGARMYRTGDVARWLANGAVEYLGRSDDQLKIRGQRIELGEIDRVMQSLPGVAQAVTHACVLNQAAAGAGDARQLVGYLVPEAGVNLDSSSLRQMLGERLPAHMVPVALVALAQLPLSANGKLDRKALPLPELAARVGRAPAPGMETTVANAFAGLLACDVAFAEDDFFALGGHSLLAMRLAATLSRETGKPLTVGQIMVASTVEALAAVLEDGSQADDGFGAILPLRDASGPRLFCFHPASGLAWQFSILQRYLPAHWAITGIQSPRPEGPMATAQDLDALVAAHLHTLRSCQPHGPYYLLGYSLGGTLAHALAGQLRAAGETVAFLGLLDTWPPETQNWSDKAANQLDPAVLAEIERERQAFIAAQQGNSSSQLFETIEGNYGDAVRLLTTAHSRPFDGEATLFVARDTLPGNLSPQQAWSPWVTQLKTHDVACSHAEIIAPAQFATIGPILAQALAELEG